MRDMPMQMNSCMGFSAEVISEKVSGKGNSYVFEMLTEKGSEHYRLPEKMNE